MIEKTSNKKKLENELKKNKVMSKCHLPIRLSVAKYQTSPAQLRSSHSPLSPKRVAEREKGMEKMLALRSLCRSVCSRSYRMAAVNHQLLRHYYAARSLSSPPSSTTSPNVASSGTLFFFFSLDLSLMSASSFLFSILFVVGQFVLLKFLSLQLFHVS